MFYCYFFQSSILVEKDQIKINNLCGLNNRFDTLGYQQKENDGVNHLYFGRCLHISVVSLHMCEHRKIFKVYLAIFQHYE